jgi:4-amino-4-deoxy-L-arabinose transferase-like glycosyltransferase
MSTRRGSWWPARASDRALLLALGALLVAGIALRVGLVLARSPAFLGNGDSFFYLFSAQGTLFADLLRPAGYPLFLRLPHLVSSDLSFTVLVQHALGVGTAVLLLLLVRQVVSAGWALLPAAVVLLAGPQLLLEHAPLADAPFTFMVVAACCCAYRALEARPLLWAGLAGLLVAAASCMRALGLLFAALLVVWLVCAVPGSVRWRLLVGAIAASCAWLVLATYMIAASEARAPVGLGLSRMGGLNLYIRVAAFVDCERFTPPAGTRDLCEERPPSQRPGPYWYTLSPESPGLQRLDKPRPAANAALTRFTRAAILHQPGDYLRAVGTDLSRFWSSDAHYAPLEGESYDVSTRILLTSHYHLTPSAVADWYDTGEVRTRGGLLRALRDYERHTRLEGPALMALVLLALGGLPLARGRRLKLGLLLLGASVVALVAPVATATFAARYAVPGYGFVAATAALGAASLWERVRGLAGRRRAAAGRPPRVTA